MFLGAETQARKVRTVRARRRRRGVSSGDRRRTAHRNCRRRTEIKYCRRHGRRRRRTGGRRRRQRRRTGIKWRAVIKWRRHRRRTKFCIGIPTALTWQHIYLAQEFRQHVCLGCVVLSGGKQRHWAAAAWPHAVAGDASRWQIAGQNNDLHLSSWQFCTTGFRCC